MNARTYSPLFQALAYKACSYFLSVYKYARLIFVAVVKRTVSKALRMNMYIKMHTVTIVKVY